MTNGITIAPSIKSASDIWYLLIGFALSICPVMSLKVEEWKLIVMVGVTAQVRYIGLPGCILREKY